MVKNKDKNEIPMNLAIHNMKNEFINIVNKYAGNGMSLDIIEMIIDKILLEIKNINIQELNKSIKIEQDKEKNEDNNTEKEKEDE